MVDWEQIDTVLLDMDGCLLDLKYDNRLWNDLVPSRYAAAHRISTDEARQRLYGHLKGETRGLDFYCTEFWRRRTALDIVALHEQLAQRICYRPGALAFLGWLNATGRRAVLATNAHPHSLAVKNRHSGVCGQVHRAISSHDFGHPKEAAEFWPLLADVERFDPARTLFIDDNQAVLRAAAAFGIRHLLTIAQPDSERPARRGLTFAAFNHFAEITPAG